MQQMIETSLVAVERSRVQGVVVVDDNITTDHQLLFSTLAISHNISSASTSTIPSSVDKGK